MGGPRNTTQEDQTRLSSSGPLLCGLIERNIRKHKKKANKLFENIHLDIEGKIHSLVISFANKIACSKDKKPEGQARLSNNVFLRAPLKLFNVILYLFLGATCVM